MARAEARTSRQNARRAGGKKNKSKARDQLATVSDPTVDDLLKIKAVSHDTYGRPKTTRKTYEGYIKRGKAFLLKTVEKRRGDAANVHDDVNTEELAKAFDSEKPNQYSSMALELFLTEQCLNKGHKLSTAHGIQGAWADYWDSMDGETYGGEYTYDKDTNRVIGCPARAPTIRSLLKVIRVRDGKKGAAATRHHAEAMKADDLATIVEWSESQVGPPDGSRSAIQEDHPIFLKHIMMRAFLSTGFTLWTRNFELCGLQRRDLKLKCQSAAPFNIPYIEVHLENRKGWQSRQGWDGPLNSNTYNIYQQDVYAMDMFTHLLRWIKVLEAELGRQLEDDDYIFPYISPNGIVNPKQEMTHEFVQNLLNEFTLGAGLDKYFTTHCLRRGGAQYRLMFAPIGKRWSLSRIRWWGGWAEGESVDTLMKYLLDSLQSYESGHQDALCPTSVDASQIYLGEDQTMKPITKGDVHLLTESFVSVVNATLKSMGTATAVPALPTTTSLGKTLAVSTPMAASIPRSSTASQAVFLPLPETEVMDAHPVVNPPIAQLPAQRNAALPLPGVRIPNLPRTNDAWRMAVRQWEEGDPAQNVPPLKDWPSHWYTGTMRLVTGTKRRERQLIAEEYERLGRNDTAFSNMYGSVSSSTSALIRAIRDNAASEGRLKRRRSKNGSPNERAASRP